MNGTQRMKRPENGREQRQDQDRNRFSRRSPISEKNIRTFARSGNGEFAAEDFLGPEALRCMRRS